MVENGVVKLYPTFQGRPEVKYLLQGGSVWKEEFIGYVFQAFRYLIKMEICLEATFPLAMSSTCGGIGVLPLHD